MRPAPVETLQHDGELAQLVELYLERRPARVLEVGTFAGGTLYQWLTNAAPRAVVVSIDTHEHRDNRALYPRWTRYDVELVVLQGNSTDPAIVEQAAAHGPYEWVYIDGDHYLAVVRADVEHYGRLAAPGGVIVLHDITPTTDPSIEVDQLWRELEHEHDTTTIAEPGGFGFGIVHVPPAARRRDLGHASPEPPASQ